MPRNPELKALFEELAEPFDPQEVKWKPQQVKNNRCMAIAYVDARVIQDRLDDVLGAENWQDGYEVLNDGCVVCRLSVTIGENHVITKTDVGSPSEQPDQGDRLKASFSDALKRAAVKYGIGRYLYRLPHQWVDYDPVKKQIVRLPQLPAFALPKNHQPQKPVQNAAPPKQAQQQAKPSDAIRMAKEDWANRLKGVGCCQDYTDLLPLFKKIPSANGDVKDAVWEMISEHADMNGYHYDGDTKRFESSTSLPEENDPIPF